jgi:uncharacterized protein (TIGR02246 family)
MPTDTQDEREIRTLLERWAQAVRAGDLASVLAHHADDVVMFDVPPPVQLRGLDAYGKSWPDFFQWRREHNGVFDIVSLDICAGIDVAFATAVLRCASEARRRQNDEPRLRLTVGLKKSGGRWLIAHEHHSFPQGDFG